MGRYTYCDSDLAGDRLELVATLFGPTTRSFLLDTADLLYARLLLAHLVDPVAALARWPTT